MSDLHIALLILAGLLLAALYGYSKWQERRMLRELDATVRQGVGDPLMQPTVVLPKLPIHEVGPVPRVEPPAISDLPPEFAQPQTAEPVGPAVEVTDLPLSALRAGGRVEPRFDPLPSALDSAAEVAHAAPGHAQEDGPDDALTAAVATPRWVEDPMLDWVLELRCTHAVDGVTVFDAAAPLTRIDSPLPMFIVAWDARSQQWVEPDRFGFYAELLVATQLANRRHRLDEIAASRFVALVQQLAMTLDADFDVPDVARAVDSARELDALCARFDVQIGMTLQSTAEPWDTQRVLSAAAAARLQPERRDDGSYRWLRLADDGETVFSVSAAALPTDRLSLELDVPLAPVAADPLRSLFKCADALAMYLGARVVDDNGRPVNAASLSGIAEQLEQLYADMQAAGVEPGSARARRLFGA